VDAYGNNESIVSNCHVRIAFAPNQYETGKPISDMIGATTVQKATYNFSGQRFSPVMGHLNASVDNIERPLITPDEVLRLNPRQKAGHGIQERIVAPGQMLIFVSGYHPILGMQMMYFLDPTFKIRSEILPPTRFVSLNRNRILDQTPADRPEHFTGTRETPTLDLSRAEQAFLDGLDEMDEFEELKEEFRAEESH
jgi:type IV secretory pathway TraG/TraD family ATPase VirD4